MNKRIEKIDAFFKNASQSCKKAKKIHFADIYGLLMRYGLTDKDREFIDGDIQYVDGVENESEFLSKIDNIVGYTDKTQIDRFIEAHKESGKTQEQAEQAVKEEFGTNRRKWISYTQFGSYLKNLHWVSGVNANFLYFDFSKKQGNKSGLKLYIPVGKEGARNLVPDLVRYIGTNVAGTYSMKVAARIRPDDIVIRVGSMEDAQKISEFINSDEIDENGKKRSDYVIETNPFLVNEDNIGYASDGILSYNETVAINIVKYLEQLRKNNSLDSASADGFKQFVFERYRDSFFSADGVKKFIKSENEVPRKPNEDTSRWLFNKMAVTELILISLEEDATKDDVIAHSVGIDEDKRYTREMMQYMVGLQKSKTIPIYLPEPKNWSGNGGELNENTQARERILYLRRNAFETEQTKACQAYEAKMQKGKNDSSRGNDYER